MKEPVEYGASQMTTRYPEREEAGGGSEPLSVAEPEPSISDLLKAMGVGHRSNGPGQARTLYLLSTNEVIGYAHADNALAVAEAHRAQGDSQHEGQGRG